MDSDPLAAVTVETPICCASWVTIESRVSSALAILAPV
jgi:hypothetical protein